DGRYQLGCLYIGVNDVRSADWNAAAFEQNFLAALRFLAARCDRVVALTAPLDLGRPRAGANVVELNAVVARAASSVGSLVVDLSDFGARNLVMVEIGRAQSELQSLAYLVCRLLLEKKNMI